MNEDPHGQGYNLLTFENLGMLHDKHEGNVTIEKGSITLNGISLTVVDSGKNKFSVAIIPYTYEHTNLQFLKTGNSVNLEFDIVGKYVAKLVGMRRPFVAG